MFRQLAWLLSRFDGPLPLLLQGLLGSALPGGSTPTPKADSSAMAEPTPHPHTSDAPTHSAPGTLPSLHLVWVSCAQAAIQAAVLTADTGTPNTLGGPRGAPTPTPGCPSGRSILQESFWRHRHPQLKARSSAAHPALDWLYPALAALAAVEQAALQLPTGFTYGPHFAGQVCRRQLVSLLGRQAYAWVAL